MSGLGAFIKGAFEGYEYGENVKDRKTQRKRNEKRWEWEQENQERRRDDWDWQDEQRDYTRTQRERQREALERQEAERERIAEIYDEARESYDAGQQKPEPGQVETTSTRESQPQGRGVTSDAPTRPQARPRTVAPQPSVSSEGPMQPQPGQPAPSGAGFDRPNMPQQQSVDQTQPGQTMQPGRSVRGAAGQTGTDQGAPMPRSFAENQRAQQAAANNQVSVEQLWSVMRPEDRQLFIEMDGQPTPTPPQTRPQTAADGRPQQAAQQPQAPSAPQGNGFNRPEAGQRPGAPQAAPQKPGSPGAAPVVGNLDVRDASTDELDQQATQNPPDKGGAPSVESASDAMSKTAATSKGVVGPGAKKVNPKDEERASKNFLDHYAKTAAPKIVDYYLSQGNVEKAKAFDTWAKSRKVKGQMESWSKAIWAITNGDEQRFIDHISDTYNAIDDGLSIDREKSKFIHDDQGNIVGGQLAVMNDETGEVSIQNFEDQQDIVEMAIYTLAPEQTFEYLYQMSEQAREMRIEDAKGREGFDQFKLAQEIRREAERLSEANITAGEGQRMTEEQIQERARSNVYDRLGISTGASTGQGGGGGESPAQEPARL